MALGERVAMLRAVQLVCIGLLSRDGMALCQAGGLPDCCGITASKCVTLCCACECRIRPASATACIPSSAFK